MYHTGQDDTNAVPLVCCMPGDCPVSVPWEVPTHGCQLEPLSQLSFSPELPPPRLVSWDCVVGCFVFVVYCAWSLDNFEFPGKRLIQGLPDGGAVGLHHDSELP